MAYVRISLVQPKRGREAQVRALLGDLARHYATQPGNIASFRLEHREGLQRPGRVTIWQSERDAERAALSEHDLAVRAQLIEAIEPETHAEFSYEGFEASASVEAPEPAGVTWD